MVLLEQGYSGMVTQGLLERSGPHHVRKQQRDQSAMVPRRLHTWRSTGWCGRLSFHAKRTLTEPWRRQKRKIAQAWLKWQVFRKSPVEGRKEGRGTWRSSQPANLAWHDFPDLPTAPPRRQSTTGGHMKEDGGGEALNRPLDIGYCHRKIR
jgi:hypothetical protein